MLINPATKIKCDSCQKEQVATDEHGNYLPEIVLWGDVRITPVGHNWDEYGGEHYGHLCPDCREKAVRDIDLDESWPSVEP